MAESVQIGSTSYASYASVEQADAYLAAAIHATNWWTATDDTKARALVSASRMLDRQDWLGDKTDPDQVLAWPRSNTGVDGVEDDVIPEPIVSAAIELALALVDGATVQTDANTSQKIQSISAGSVSISYFRGAEGVARRFPLIIHELVRDYLSGSAGLAIGTGSIAFGVDGESSLENDYGLTGPI